MRGKATDPEPWERQEGETAKAFDAFCAYRDLGPGKRSMLAAWQANSGKTAEKQRKAPRYWEEWAIANNWPDRAAAYDAHIESAVRAEVETEKIATAVEFVRAAKTRLFAELKDPGGDWRAALEALKRLCRDEWGDSVELRKLSDDELIARTAALLGRSGAAGTETQPG